MRQKRWTLLAVVIGIALYTLWEATTYAQLDACPGIAANVLVTLKTVCQVTGRDQICYAHRAVIPEIELQDPSAPAPVFENPGDLLKVIETRNLQLQSLDLESKIWGAAWLQVQASIPDSRPENVTLLLLGGIDLKNEDSTMQTFTFSSEADSASCGQLPNSGLLIQTPEGVGEISLLVNQVDIRLGSTAFIQVERDNVLSVNLLEGDATITALGESVTLAPGEVARVPLLDLFPDRRPTIESINPDDLRALGPFVAVLPRPIQLPEIEVREVRVAPTRRITYGGVVTDTLTAGEAHPWEFIAQRGDVVTITLEKNADDALDPSLELVNPNRVIVIRNEDYLPDGRAGVFDLTLSQNGAYTIWVRDEQANPGAYKLALSGRRLPTATFTASPIIPPEATFTPVIFPTVILTNTPIPVFNYVLTSVIGGNAFANVTVTNAGPDAAPPTSVDLNVDYGGSVGVVTFNGGVPPLLAGDSVTITINAPPQSGFGAYPATAIVDPTNSAAETNEGDNSGTTLINYPVP